MSNKMVGLALWLGGAALLNVGTQANAASTQKSPTDSVASRVVNDSFLGAKRCLEAGLRIEATANVDEVCKSIGSKIAQGARCGDGKTAMRSNRIFAAQETGCSADPIVLEENFHTAVVAAAQAGNSDAEVCYVSGWSRLDPRERNTYVNNAQAYIRAGLARGDWRVVELMSRSPTDGGVGVMVNLPDMGSHFTTYRFNRLLQLGASGDYAGIARVSADNEERFLTKAQVATGNEWATEEYSKYFARSPKLTSAPVPCLSTIPGD